jgi:ribosomal protein S18 acetylase RimI-like enzyme
MQTYVYREMRIQDYDTVYALWGNTSGMGLSVADEKENIKKFLNKNKGLCFVCEFDNTIVGTVLCGYDGRRGYIYHVTVVQEHRGKGIGTKMVELSLQGLKAEGIDKCHLFVFADNPIGNTFWKSTGWQKRDDVIVYSKSI